jgi:PilZ domain
MKQSRRVSPRIPYDEAVCLARVDGRGRLFGRSVDLGPAGIYVTCAELCEIGTELVCSVLLPGGPRRLRGRVVRLVALPRAVGIAITFTELREADRLVIERLVASRRPETQQVKLRVGGLDHDLRCEAVIDEGERTMRVSTALPPFLRLDAAVGVMLDDGRDARKRGVIRRIAVDPAPRDGLPRLALDLELGAPDTADEPGATDPAIDDRAPPSGLPRPYRHPLPSVLVSGALARQMAADAPNAAPPRRRRSHGTAEIARRFTDAGARVLAVAQNSDLTQPVTAAYAPVGVHSHPLSIAWLAVPIVLATATLALLARFAH